MPGFERSRLDHIYDRIRQLETDLRPYDAEIRACVSSYLNHLAAFADLEDYTPRDVEIVERGLEYGMDERVEDVRRRLGENLETSTTGRSPSQADGNGTDMMQQPLGDRL